MGESGKYSSDKGDYVPLKEQEEWRDVTPIPQEEEPNTVCPIAYTDEYSDMMSYLRAVMAKREV
ncbi:hypothetical protein EV177_009940, partial [Coemansia sp. RSA 1804]